MDWVVGLWIFVGLLVLWTACNSANQWFISRRIDALIDHSAAISACLDAHAKSLAANLKLSETLCGGVKSQGARICELSETVERMRTGDWGER